MRIKNEWNWLWYKLGLIFIGIKDPRSHFDGLLTCREGITLARLAAGIPRNGLILEIGCYGGLSTAYLFQGAERRNGMVFSIDPFDTALEEQKKDASNINLVSEKLSREKVEEKLKDFGGGRIELIKGFSYDVVRTWDRPIDLLWIDGNHDYHAVKQDYEQWRPFLKPGGYIAFHDSNKKGDDGGWSEHGWPGPTRLAKEVLRAPQWGPVVRADSITYAKKEK